MKDKDNWGLFMAIFTIIVLSLVGAWILKHVHFHL
jgi:hypothetical protein